jgi:hypothetical protein
MPDRHRLSHALAAILLLAAAAPASAEIYRCESEGVIEFSDRPCSADNMPHHSERGISLVPADENLARIAADNQRFIESRREALAAQRQEQARRNREARAQVLPEALQTVVLPVPARYYQRPRQKPPVEQPRREPRYSALSGPILGTRNRDRWEEPPTTGSERRRQ